MLIDCDTCVARGRECGDCVVSVFLHISTGRTPGLLPVAVRLDDAEQAAVESLAAAGLVPPLRLVVPISTDLPGMEAGIA
jgi:hypothetical protein